MKNPDVIIYDLDGTLLDAFQDIRAALNYGLKQAGLPEHPLQAVKGFVGDGIDKLVERGLGPDNLGLLDKVLPVVTNYYRDHPAGEGNLYPGVRETLETLGNREIRQVILTNKPHQIAVDVCRHLGLEDLVDEVIGAVKEKSLKPDPSVALDVIEKFEGQPARCLVVGDGKPDIEMARLGGMISIGCTWGMFDVRQMQSLRPNYIIHSIAELPEQIESI